MLPAPGPPRRLDADQHADWMVIGAGFAGLAAGHENPMIDWVLAFDPPKRLPPEPFAYLGINAALRWKELRAGVER